MTYQSSEYDCEEVQLCGRRRETPEKEDNDSASDRAHEHYKRIWVAIAQVAKHNLATDGGRVEYRGDDDGSQWRRHGRRECRDV